MKNKNTSSSTKNLENEIKELELQIAKLRLDLAEKEKTKELLQNQHKRGSLGFDRNKNPIHIGQTVELLTLSKTGPFKGQTHAIVVGRSKRCSRRILIGKIGDISTTTNRESTNISVAKEQK